MKVINLFGGPGCGKSTLAASLFHRMKTKGINCELVTEFAKDLTWEGSPARLCQPYVFGVQYLRLERLIGKVDYAITDSPLLLANYYGRHLPSDFRACVRTLFDEFDNFNCLLSWPSHRKYNPIGRNQTEAEAALIHGEIWEMLDLQCVPFTAFSPGQTGLEQILDALHLADAT